MFANLLAVANRGGLSFRTISTWPFQVILLRGLVLVPTEGEGRKLILGDSEAQGDAALRARLVMQDDIRFHPSPIDILTE